MSKTKLILLAISFLLICAAAGALWLQQQLAPRTSSMSGKHCWAALPAPLRPIDTTRATCQRSTVTAFPGEFDTWITFSLSEEHFTDLRPALRSADPNDAPIGSLLPPPDGFTASQQATWSSNLFPGWLFYQQGNSRAFWFDSSLAASLSE